MEKDEFERVKKGIADIIYAMNGGHYETIMQSAVKDYLNTTLPELKSQILKENKYCFSEADVEKVAKWLYINVQRAVTGGSRRLGIMKRPNWDGNLRGRIPHKGQYKIRAKILLSSLNLKSEQENPLAGLSEYALKHLEIGNTHLTELTRIELKRFAKIELKSRRKGKEGK